MASQVKICLKLSVGILLVTPLAAQPGKVVTPVRNRPSGMVAHMPPGTVVLTPRAVQHLAKHLIVNPSNELATASVVADIIRMARTSHMSRDTYHRFLQGTGESELTTAQAAQRLGISPGAVRKRISRGILPAKFDGRVWRINPQDLGEESR